MRSSATLSLLVVYSLLLSLVPGSRPAAAQDLVPQDSIAGGSSAFVFRESSRKPQVRSAGGFVPLRAAGGTAAVRSSGQIAAAVKRRRAAAAAARQRAIIDAANARIRLSNKLTRSAEASMQSGQTDTAISDFRAALKQNPKNARATSGLSGALTDKGSALAGTSNSLAGVPFLIEAVQLDRSNGEALAKLGAIYDANGDVTNAILYYEKAAADPDLAVVNGPLGIAYIQKGEIAKAAASSARADAAGVDTVDTRMLKGLVALKQNRSEDALTAFDQVAKLDPQNSLARYYRGQAYARMEQNDRAVASYKEALALDPTNGPAAFDLGVEYYNAGDYKNAEAQYQQVVRNDPDNAAAHANLASTYRQLERYAEANAEYKIAAGKITDADLYSEWGYCLGKTNEWDKASARLMRAAELMPIAAANSNISWAYYNYGVTQADPAVAKANYELSRAFAEKAVAQDPRLDAAYLNLGSTQNRLGNFAAAVTALKVALDLRPNWTIAGNQLGIGYRGLGDLVNAISAFKRVTDLDAGYTYGLFNLGEAYNASGDKKAAKKVQERLKKLDPTLANTLSDVFSGRIGMPGGIPIPRSVPSVVNKLPKIPKLPY